MRITPLLLLVLLSGCGKHEKPPMKGSACGGTSCGITMTPATATGESATPIISQSCDGCSNSNIVETGSETIDKGIDKLSHNRKRPSRISP